MSYSAAPRHPRRHHQQPPGMASYPTYPSYQPPPNNHGPQLFEDTSVPSYGQPPGYGEYGPPPPGFVQGSAPPPSYYPQQDSAGFSIPGLNDPVVANMAMQYGQTLVGHGRELVDEKLEKYVSVTKLKYYFAVDNAYVMKKIGLLLFPFTHTDWSLQYRQDEPVQPRFDVNAPDLYIPVMAILTYIVTAGLALGFQNRFTPEVLGMQATSALVWLILENLAVFISFYIMNIHTNLKTYDLIAYTSYKYTGMILSLLASVIFESTGYYSLLIYSSISISFFLTRTLRVQITPSSDHDLSTGNKRRLYMILFVCGLQPVMMWWLTSHLANHTQPPEFIPRV